METTIKTNMGDLAEAIITSFTKGERKANGIAAIDITEQKRINERLQERIDIQALEKANLTARINELTTNYWKDLQVIVANVTGKALSIEQIRELAISPSNQTPKE